MKITNATYFSPKVNMKYLSASQIKAFMECEEKALAELKGRYFREPTTALLVGSYVDAYFSDEMTYFVDNHQEIYNSRTGELKRDYKHADKIINRIESDPILMDALCGENQAIITGELFGHKFKAKLDSYHAGERIVDLKVIKDMKPAFRDGEWKTFVDAWSYDIQGYVYQQLVKQQTGDELPFYLAVATKEPEPDIALIHIPQWKLNSAAAIVEHYADRVARIKSGELKPTRCEKCDYCKSTKVLTGPIEYEELVKADF